jgi:hypothetical protein
MPKPRVDPTFGISSVDVLILTERHPACRRREAQPGSCNVFRLDRLKRKNARVINMLWKIAAARLCPGELFGPGSCPAPGGPAGRATWPPVRLERLAPAPCTAF